MKPTNSPTPTRGQPNPRKITLAKSGILAASSRLTANNFSRVWIDFMLESDYKKPNSNQVLRKHSYRCDKFMFWLLLHHSYRPPVPTFHLPRGVCVQTRDMPLLFVGVCSPLFTRRPLLHEGALFSDLTYRCYLRGTIAIRTHDVHKNLCVTLFC